MAKRNLSERIKNSLRRKEKPVSATERRSNRATFSDELRGSEHRLNLYWNEIAQFLKRGDLAYVWTDKVRFKFRLIRSEARKLAFVLKKIHSYYIASPDKYRLELYHIKNLLWEINRMYSDNGKADEVKKIYRELKEIMSDIKYEEVSAATFTVLPLREQTLREFSFRELKGNVVIPDEEIEFDEDILKTLDETKSEEFVVRGINDLKAFAGALWKPSYYIKYKNAEYYVSIPFYGQGYGNYFFLAFVKAAPNTKYYFNLFFKSSSQETWRVALGLTLNGLMIKSNPENRMNLPNLLQSQLSRIFTSFGSNIDSTVQSVIKVLPVEKGFMRSTSASSDFKNHTKISKTKICREYPKYLEHGGVYRLEYLKPEKIIVLPDFEPDFNKVIDSFESTSRLYGRVSGKIVQSKNSRISYLFLNDEAGRIWLGNAELTFSPISKFGVPVEASNFPESLFIPAYEYPNQIPKGYSGKNSKGSYSDATLYLDRIPVIEKFRKVFNIQKNY